MKTVPPVRFAAPRLLTLLSLVTLAFTATLAAQTYRTSWFGNTFGYKDGKFVQQNISAIWVRGDGTVFTNSQYDEGHQSAGIYRNGDVIGKMDDVILTGGRVVTGDSAHVYLSIEGIITRRNHNGTKAPYGDGVDYWVVGNGGAYVTRGMAILGNELFVSDRDGLIRVYNKNTRAQVRSWNLSRPGKIAVAPDGTLWIIQRRDSQNAARILRFTASGAQQPQVITHSTNWDPVAVCFNPAGHLLVADDGPDQQIKIYTDLSASRSTPNATFGATGGILSGTPGAVAPLKFNGLTDVGTDSSGNIYVAQNRFGPDLGIQAHGAGTILESYTAGGQRNWVLHGLEFMDGADLDRGTVSGNIIEVHTKLSRYRLDLSRTEPGAEWSYAGHTLNRFKYPNDPRLLRQPQNGDFTYVAAVRRLGGQKFVFQTGMWARFFEVYRFKADTDGEIAIPAVVFNRQADNGYGAYVNNPTNGQWIWTDANGNGNAEANEYQSDPGQTPGVWGWWVDTNGDIWRSNGNVIERFPFGGLNAHGVPQWSFSTRISRPAPAPFNGQHSNVRRLEVDPTVNNGTAYLNGYQEWPSGGDEKAMGSKIARYDNWNTANPTLRWEVNIPWSRTVTTDIPQGMSVAGDYIFVVYSGFGTNSQESRIRVFRTSDGSFVSLIAPGSEVGNHSGASDIPYGLRAWKRSDSEYLIFAQENNNAKMLLYRWNPQGSGAPVGKRITLRADAANGLFVSNDLNDARRLKAVTNFDGEWEHFEVVDAGSGHIGLRALNNNRFVSADLGNSLNLLRADWAQGIGSWERFVWNPAGSGKVALYSVQAQRYVSCHLGEGNVLTARWATGVGDWERFTWGEVQAGAPLGRRIAIRSAANNRFVSNHLNNNRLLLAQWATSAGDWEQFDVVDAGNGQIGLRAANNGRFASNNLNWGNRIVADWATSIGGWERFTWVPLDNGRFALRSVANGKLITADLNDSGILKASTADVAQTWEEFEFQIVGP